MKQFLLLFTILLFILKINAQSDLTIGQWESHLPYIVGTSVTQSDTKVYYSTGLALLVFDKEDLSYQRISKVEGLSNVGISIIKYNKASSVLLIVYDNGVMDLIKDDADITTLYYIKNFTNITGDKKVFDIHASEDGSFYLAANWGISKIDPLKEEFEFTTFTDALGLEINGVCTYNGYVYAAAEDGLYRVEENNAFIEAFSQWELLGEERGFPSDYTPTAIENFNAKLYIGLDNSLYSYDGEMTTDSLYSDTELPVKYLSAEGTRLLIGYADPTTATSGNVLSMDTEDTLFPLPGACSNRPLDAVEDQYQRVWFADSYRDFRRLGSFDGQFCAVVSPDSPYSQNNKELITYGDELWVTTGGISGNLGYRQRKDGFFSYIDNDWKVYNQFNTADLANLENFENIEIDQETGTIYAGTFWGGLVVYDRETYTVYNEENSSMTNVVSDETRTRVSGLALDSERSLWVINHLGARPISVFRQDGSWENFPSCGGTSLLAVTVDDLDYKWIIQGGGNSGFMVFDEKENRCRAFSVNNSELQNNLVNCITKDLDGDMWVGTAEGIVIFECGSNVFDESCTGSRRIIEVDGISAYLLKDENVRSITVDGANRKWVGTSNGVFIISPDGKDLVEYINEENSPLFDNLINDIAISENGIAYIGTDKGIQSVRGEATKGNTLNNPNANVFPNPVRPDYDGPIAINGLANNADVKITDVRGILIYETEALGGQAIWDGKDYNGRRAASGVYLVFSTSVDNLDNPDAVVAKILVMN